VTLRERIGQLDRLQRSRGFQIGASILVVVLAIGVFGWFFVNTTSGTGDTDGLPVDSITQILNQRTDLTGVGVASAAIAAVALGVIWLGLAITYTGILAGLALIALPISLIPGGELWANLLVGIGILTASFTAILQGLRTGLGVIPSPICTVAKNVLNEAVRLKLSLVFIVLLIFGLAALPGLLDADQPLRYRVQSFLQYATGGSFWIIAVLTLFFGVATVTFEQRDKIIWQTMTKPVSASQYILGKWLGVSLLAAALLTVCASGTFLFVEYLRNLPALGERTAFVAEGSAVAEDRLLLETQVLQASRTVDHTPPFLPDDENFANAAQRYIDNARLTTPDFAETTSERRRVEADLYKSLLQSFRSVEPGQNERFAFEGLERAKERGELITLRYRIDALGNRPDKFFWLTFVTPTGDIITRQVGLGFTHTLPVSPAFINDAGELWIEIYNGRYGTLPSGEAVIVPNEATFTFPADGLTVTFAAGSYRMNFFRVMLVLWIKLAFLAMIAVVAGTFLSFPVACIVALGTFFAAESASWVIDSAGYYGVTDDDGNFQLHKWIVVQVSTTVGRIFQVYSDLQPTTRLVEGRLLSWGGLGIGTSVLSISSLILFLLGVFIFRRRELATYSGQ
jgi:hypothetical protein